MAAAEAAILAGVTKISSGDPELDAASNPEIKGIAFYYTREPNKIIDITSVWDKKVAAVRKYKAQFDTAGMEEMILMLDAKSRQVATGRKHLRGEPLKILNLNALHCGL
jgi:LmbE family N-acetylglucosaminyl deacetylase